MKFIRIFSIIGMMTDIFKKTGISFMRIAITAPTTRSTRVLLLITSVLVIQFFGSMSVQAQTIYYVRAGATGANNGSDWNNAYDKLPASLVRGATYYVADGSYGSYFFDSPVSGTQLITIKKATIADHVTSTGWNNSYGDGQAVFGELEFKTNYYVIDGSTRNESDWTNGAAYGFRVRNVYSSSSRSGACADNLTVKYSDIGGTYSLTFDNGIPDAGFYFGGFYGDICQNWTIQRNYIHNIRIIGQMAGTNNITWEYNWMGPAWSKAGIRGQNQSTNSIFRYNVIKNACRADGCPDCEGCTADIALFSNVGQEPDFDGFAAYGNVIWKDAGIFNCCGSIYAETSSGGVIHNNTVVSNGTGSARFRLNSVPGSAIRNNISYLPNGMTTGCEAATCDNNSIYTSSPPFINTSTGNFHLSTALSGVALGSAYNLDMDRNIRGADGTWDRGAFEYGGGSGGVDSSPILPPSAVRIQTP